MPSLKDLRNRITSVQSTRKITKAMQMVAVSKLRRAQAAAEGVADGLDPMEDKAGDAEVKRRWAAVLTRRALAELAGGPHGA